MFFSNPTKLIRSLLIASLIFFGQSFAQTQGGEISSAISATGIRGFETWQDTTGVETHLYNLIFDKLVWYDASYNLQPGLFESWHTEDAKIWTFNVRPNVTWHDGAPLTAHQIIDFFDKVADPSSGATTEKSSILQDVTYQALDDLTIEMTLPAPNSVLLDTLDLLYIVRVSDFDANNPIGTGPFQLDEWNRNQSMVFSRNDQYWQDDLPYLDQVTIRMVPDATTRLNMLLTGEVDIIDDVPASEVERLETMDDIQIVTTPGEYITTHFFMLYKTTLPPFDNKLVRQAINYAIDRETLLDINFGYGSVKSNAIGEGSVYFNPNAISYNTRDVEKAKALMEEAGYPPGQEAFSVTLYYWQEWPENIQIVQIVQANLAEIGITVNLELLEIGTWVDLVINQHNYEMALTALIPGWDPDTQLSNVYITDDGSALEWQNEAFTAAIAAGRSTANIEERKAAYATAQEIAMEEAPAVVLNTVPRFVATNMRVANVIRHDSGNILYQSIWLNP